MVVIAELLVNNYFGGNMDNVAPATVLETNVLQPAETPLPVPAASDMPVADSQKGLDLSISSDMLTSLGFQTPDIREVPFNGKLFQMVDLDSFGIDEVKKANVFDGNEFRLAYHEISLSSSVLALEVYRLIRQEGSETESVKVNETNQYGSASFYLNNAYKAKTAFLVALIGDSVYGFEYPRESHGYVKGILGKLSRKVER